MEDSGLAFQPMSEEEFTTWLTFLTDQLEGFLSNMEDSTAKRFDFSPESLQSLGEAIITLPYTLETLVEEKQLFSDLYSYVAEVFHRNLGAQFFLPQDKDDPVFGEPSIRVASGLNLSLPQLILETARRKDPAFLDDTFKSVRDGWIFSQDETEQD